MNAKTISLAGEMLMTPADKVVECRNMSAAMRRQLASRDLFGGGNELNIEHNGEIYTLRQTRQGKLILTK
jgi:hemin uptake protein HemP